MRIARLLSALAVMAAIVGVAVLVLAMGTAAPQEHDASPAARTSAENSIIPLQPVSIPSSTPDPVASSSSATTSPSSTASTPSQTPRLTPSAKPLVRTASPTPSVTAEATGQASTTRPAPHPTTSRPTVAVVRGVSLPLGYSTGNATRVITVVASSHSSTVATLQAWVKAPGGGWLRWGSAITAHVGSQGLTSSPSESKSATPIGSFTLTQAFGHNANPGTSLPYRHTTSADWWISQAGPLYNTEQHCASDCSFRQGSPNEHLYYETPYYNYAVVIDYNRFPVRQGAGSAFFLHVTDGHPTAGCVAIPQSSLLNLMTKFLTPATHPRILIGVT